MEIGSPVHWKGKTENGVEIIYVKGEVVEYEEGKRITTTMIDPNSNIADIPANYVNLTYQLEEKKDSMLLTIIQGDFSGAAEGKKRYEESKSGWKEIVIPILQKMI